MTMKKRPLIKMRAGRIFYETGRYILSNPLFILCVFVVNMVYMLLLKAIPRGIQNLLFVVWIVTYYVFWCFFYRYYYRLKPYFLRSAILGSLTPSTKALFLLALCMFGLALLPMLPLFLGFDDVYMDVYEKYLQPAAQQDMRQISGTTMLWAYGIMILLAPVLICKPYLAWISSLRGQNASFRKVGDKTKGNYWQFVLISAILLLPEALGSKLDAYFDLQSWLDYTVRTIVFIYTNIIFAKIYDFFYLKH